MSYRVVKTNRFGRAQERMVSLDFNSGTIVNKNGKGKTMKDHHASSVLFVECLDPGFQLVIHFPKKEYKLQFNSNQERTEFQEKLVDLCQTTKRMNMPVEEEMFNPDTMETGGKSAYTFAFKYSYNSNPKLDDVVVIVDGNGLALCDPKPQQGDGGTGFKVQRQYSFQQLKSWTNEGRYVEVETINSEKVDELYKFKGTTESDADALVEAIQVCIAAAMKKIKADRAAKKAAKAAAAAAGATGQTFDTETPAAKPMPVKANRAERMRRASMVVDLSAMADGIVEDGTSGAALRKDGLLNTMISSPDQVMNSQKNLMAAACRAIAEEDEFLEDDDDEDEDEGIGLDIVDVMMSSLDAAPVAEGREATLHNRRQSVMMDITGGGGGGGGSALEPGTDRSKRANLLKDLAGIIEEADQANAAAAVAPPAALPAGPKVAKKAGRSKANKAARRRSVMVSSGTGLQTAVGGKAGSDLGSMIEGIDEGLEEEI